MVADTHILEPESARILDRGLERIQSLGKPSFVVLGGDMTESGEEGQYRTLQQSLSRLAIPQHAVVGNHDIGNSTSRRGYTRFFGPPNRSFDFEGVRCLILDTNNSDPDPTVWHGKAERPALEWLERQLSRLDRETPILLFTHQGLVGAREELECDVENSEQVLALLDGHNLRAGFAAHAHRLRVTKIGKAEFYVCPALSTRKGNKGGEPPGILIVDVFPDEIRASLMIVPGDPSPPSPGPSS
jgi:3',5'-cyclic AMP phosphodiesterase CpdA